MNSDYVIYVRTRRGRTWTYLKERDDWTQTASTGIVRRLSSDQLLSHLLPPLAGDQPSLTVTVERKKSRSKSALKSSAGLSTITKRRRKQ
jgi:hypothetical protein